MELVHNADPPPLSHPMVNGTVGHRADLTQCHRRTNPGICALRGKIYFHDGNAKSRPLGEGAWIHASEFGALKYTVLISRIQRSLIFRLLSLYLGTILVPCWTAGLSAIPTVYRACTSDCISSAFRQLIFSQLPDRPAPDRVYR